MLHGCTEKQNLSLSVEKIFRLFTAFTREIFFNSRSDHVISFYNI